VKKVLKWFFHTTVYSYFSLLTFLFGFNEVQTALIILNGCYAGVRFDYQDSKSYAAFTHAGLRRDPSRSMG